MATKKLPLPKLKNGWRYIKDEKPPKDTYVLMSNNPTSTNARGEMSHVWIGTIFKSDRLYDGWAETVNGAQRVLGVQAWRPLPMAVSPPRKKKPVAKAK